VTRTGKAAAGAFALILGVTLSGCGSDDKNTDTSTPLKIAITVTGDSVTPNGDRVDVAVGQPIELDVTADAPGEIHVHSTPEQEFEYDAGSTTLTLDPIEVPGVVDIESHTLDKTIVQLEVR
jgi:hypothetical protein